MGASATEGDGMRLQVGDLIERAGETLAIEIVADRPTGYTWRYVRRDRHGVLHFQDGAPTYESDRNDDPFFDRGWRVMIRDAVQRRIVRPCCPDRRRPRFRN